MKELDKLRALRPNWDSYGAPPIDERAIQAAGEFLASVWVVPTSKGGVQVEYHHGGLDIEVEFGPDGQVLP